MTKLLQRALGEYAKGGDNRFLYKTDGNRETANSHSAGSLAFRGKRVAVFEELDRTQKINQQDLKTYTGGEGHVVSVRAPHGTATLEFEWTCRFILNFNEDDLPSFDTNDVAFLNRMLAIPHRSRFYLSDVDYEANKHVPYTYRAVDDFASKHFGVWCPYFLRWMLEGYGIWNVERFKTIPDGCLALKNRLVDERNVVARFITETLVRTDDDADRVYQKDLWTAYRSWTEGQSRLTKPAFCKGLKRTLRAFHVYTDNRDQYKRHRFGGDAV